MTRPNGFEMMYKAARKIYLSNSIKKCEIGDFVWWYLPCNNTAVLLCLDALIQPTGKVVLEYKPKERE